MGKDSRPTRGKGPSLGKWGGGPFVSCIGYPQRCLQSVKLSGFAYALRPGTTVPVGPKAHPAHRRRGRSRQSTPSRCALGATLGVAGLYQFTTLKHICLSHCRSPLAFVAQHWRDGRVGALEMGLRHGLYCFGCCWALFAVLVATGVMSIAWMLLLTLVVFVEKLPPRVRRFEGSLGVALVALGIVVSLGAIDMPWMRG